MIKIASRGVGEAAGAEGDETGVAAGAPVCIWEVADSSEAIKCGRYGEVIRALGVLSASTAD